METTHPKFSRASRPPNIIIINSTLPLASSLSSPSSSATISNSPSSPLPTPCPCPCGGPLRACRLLTCPSSPHLVTAYTPSGVPRLGFLGPSNKKEYQERQRQEQEEVVNTLNRASEILKTLPEVDFYADCVCLVPTCLPSQSTCEVSFADSDSLSGMSMRLPSPSNIGLTDPTQKASIFDEFSASYSHLAGQNMCKSLDGTGKTAHLNISLLLPLPEETYVREEPTGSPFGTPKCIIRPDTSDLSTPNSRWATSESDASGSELSTDVQLQNGNEEASERNSFRRIFPESYTPAYHGANTEEQRLESELLAAMQEPNEIEAADAVNFIHNIGPKSLTPSLRGITPGFEHYGSDGCTAAQLRNETNGAGAHAPTPKRRPVSQAPTTCRDTPRSDCESGRAEKRNAEIGAARSISETTSKTHETLPNPATSDATVTGSDRKKRATLINDEWSGTSGVADNAGCGQKETPATHRARPEFEVCGSSSDASTAARGSKRKRTATDITVGEGERNNDPPPRVMARKKPWRTI